MAIGECGLDYDRLNLAEKEEQLKVFPLHFELTEEYNLPLYLHCRAAEEDFIKIMKENKDRYPAGGVVHSFTGSAELLKECLDLGLYIGVNGCSLKTEKNCEVVA